MFRDQQFSGDMGSRAVKRIRDARLIRDHQFQEDGGPRRPSRPPRPLRGDRQLLHPHGVLQGRGGHPHDAHPARPGRDSGAAWTSTSNATTARPPPPTTSCPRCRTLRGVDLGQFRRWYSQAGTPILHLEDDYDPEERVWSVRVRQELPATADGSPKAPMHVPLAVGLVGRDGRTLAPASAARSEEAGPEPVDSGGSGRAGRHGGARRPGAGRDLSPDRHRVRADRVGAPGVLRPGPGRDGAPGRGPPHPPRPRPRPVRALGRGADARPLPPRPADRARDRARGRGRGRDRRRRAPGGRPGGGRPHLPRSDAGGAARPLHRRRVRGPSC